MTRLRFCWSSRIEMVAFLMYDILYDTSRLVKAIHRHVAVTAHPSDVGRFAAPRGVPW